MVEHVVNLIHAHVLMDGRDPHVIYVSQNKSSSPKVSSKYFDWDMKHV